MFYHLLSLHSIVVKFPSFNYYLNFVFVCAFFEKKMSSANTSYGSNTGGGASGYTVKGTTVNRYICGNCGHRNELEIRQAIICNACGSRILYKARTKRLVQFEAV